MEGLGALELDLSMGTGYLERLWSLHPWRFSKYTWTWSFATSSRSPFLRWGLDPMTSSGPFQIYQFCVSVTQDVWRV